jgi:hypothetical protein
MTEAEWLSSTDPQRMLGAFNFTRDSIQGRLDPPSGRKLRMFACACCLLRGTSQEVVNSYEETGAPIDDLDADRMSDQEWALEWARNSSAKVPALATKATLLREIVGNPYRPVLRIPTDYDGGIFHHDKHILFYEEWITPTVLSLAQGIYERQDWDLMPVLADCLEDAGCDNERILMHLKGYKETHAGTHIRSTAYPMIHVRGCWCLDLILGKD